MALSDYITNNVLFWKIFLSLFQWFKGITSIIICLGIIIYEKHTTDNYKTLLNYLNVLLMYTTIGLSFFGFCMTGILVEQMPVFLCNLQMVMVMTFLTGFFIVLTQMVFVRFMYCCWFKGYGRLNEEFWIYYFKIGKHSKD